MESIASGIISIETDKVIICPVQANGSSMPSFNEPECSAHKARDIDPQNKLIWVKTSINIPDSMRRDKQPHSVYISGKTSSKLYFNGHYLGQNGTPSLNAGEEFPGKIDAMFYVPSNIIKDQTNDLILLLSSHHGFLNLRSPINFIGFGVYSNPSLSIRSGVWQAFLPLGALILGSVYFAVSCFGPNRRRTNLLFLSMSLTASLQLLLEFSRAVFSYSYPLQDFRLLLIVLLSITFGILLLTYVVFEFVSERRLLFILMGSSTTILMVALVSGFDPKTATAILVPTLFSTIIVAVRIFKQRTHEEVSYLIILSILNATILLNLNNFHTLLFYYVITGALCFLFVKQAIKSNQEQARREEEEKLVAKLQFKLEQNEQKTSPNKINISSAGKIELISTEKIIFCKASGDYVEIYLENGEQRLYSGNLKDIETKLPSTFLRVHRSYVVNIEFIKQLRSASKSSFPNGSGSLVLADGFEIPVSRRIMPQVRSAITQTALPVKAPLEGNGSPFPRVVTRCRLFS